MRSDAAACAREEMRLSRHKLSTQVRLSLGEDEYVTDPSQTVVSGSSETCAKSEVQLRRYKLLTRVCVKEEMLLSRHEVSIQAVRRLKCS
ncbi:hypothetical protein PRECH8_02290 [Insulibacter thermoxylanivorax]|uniref:Uncharacterized protein n=1 Tax=Insulibacter thermoxylanivorax TaxID=2749268 RepID=A0A916QD71_9BACL|nr:hypothetical protein PRECH8_02290 [Insulibacter thermoxylanivorax]